MKEDNPNKNVAVMIGYILVIMFGWPTVVSIFTDALGGFFVYPLLTCVGVVLIAYGRSGDND